MYTWKNLAQTRSFFHLTSWFFGLEVRLRFGCLSLECSRVGSTTPEKLYFWTIGTETRTPGTPSFEIYEATGLVFSPILVGSTINRTLAYRFFRVSRPVRVSNPRYDTDRDDGFTVNDIRESRDTIRSWTAVTVTR